MGTGAYEIQVVYNTQQLGAQRQTRIILKRLYSIQNDRLGTKWYELLQNSVNLRVWVRGYSVDEKGRVPSHEEDRQSSKQMADSVRFLLACRPGKGLTQPGYLLGSRLRPAPHGLHGKGVEDNALCLACIAMLLPFPLVLVHKCIPRLSCSSGQKGIL